ncbi:uncharacterized protein LOC119767301 [Culex quinquefasciatus]|uniref:uncharacterized protein LOC119767301 n=1 Tax=Culex quinquefasciatus TaxID=7176 RepID=UPI0018E3C0F0|nr:uncharacterized protein LOC119767301 [Culex quinquefasciatus]
MSPSGFKSTCQFMDLIIVMNRMKMEHFAYGVNFALDLDEESRNRITRQDRQEVGFSTRTIVDGVWPNLCCRGVPVRSQSSDDRGTSLHMGQMITKGTFPTQPALTKPANQSGVSSRQKGAGGQFKRTMTSPIRGETRIGRDRDRKRKKAASFWCLQNSREDIIN